MAEISALPSEASVAVTPGSNPGVVPERELIPLLAAFGQDEANHGTTRYPVDLDRLVRVPREAVDPLTSKGGFAVQKTSGEMVSIGMLKLHHQDAAGCSYLGQQYLGDKNGDVVVPAEAASELIAHGFVCVLLKSAFESRRAKLSPAHRSAKV